MILVSIECKSTRAQHRNLAFLSFQNKAVSKLFFHTRMAMCDFQKFIGTGNYPSAPPLVCALLSQPLNSNSFHPILPVCLTFLPCVYSPLPIKFPSLMIANCFHLCLTCVSLIVSASLVSFSLSLYHSQFASVLLMFWHCSSYLFFSLV